MVERVRLFEEHKYRGVAFSVWTILAGVTGGGILVYLYYFHSFA